MKILAATLLTSRKSNPRIERQSLEAIDKLPIDSIYINSEVNSPESTVYFNGFTAWWETIGLTKPLMKDIWYQSRQWLGAPQYDQDQKRLVPITIARNMAVDVALHGGFSHLLFIDSDVIPDVEGFNHLLEMAKEGVNLCGGHVPGRGAHSHVHYVFGSMRGIQHRDNVIICDHGTCGYMLISRKVFGQLRFRWGDDRHVEGQMLSEDPAYCYDWYDISGGERFQISTKAIAQHLGDLKETEVAKDEWSSINEQYT